MFAFEKENHTKYLTESLQGLFKHNLLVDCTLSADYQFIHGHQVVLAACSPYFELLFSQKKDRKPIVLKDVKFQALKLLVDFMYFGEVYIPTEQLNSFLETAKALQVKGLTNLYKQENNVESCDDSEVNVENKCETGEWNCCENTFEIKRESENHSSALDTSEREKCAQLNYNAHGCNEDSVRELSLSFNRGCVNEKSKVDSQNPDNNSTGVQFMTQYVAGSNSSSGVLMIEYEDIFSAVSHLPFIKEEKNESYFTQDGSNCTNDFNRNGVDHCPLDFVTFKREIEIEENELNFHENHEVANLSEITSKDAFPCTSQNSLNHATANVECHDDSVVNVGNKCESEECNFCEKSFEIKRESENHSSTSGTSEREECAELNCNADGCNEDTVKELNLAFNRVCVNKISKVDSQNPDNNSTGGQHMTQDVAESESFSAALNIEYGDNSSALSLLPFIKEEENESHFMQDDSCIANVFNRNGVDTESVINEEIEIEENILNFHENQEVANPSEITSNDALPSTSEISLNHVSAESVISGADSYKDFNVNFENISSEFVSTSPKPDGVQESRERGGDNVILGLENVDLNERSSDSSGQGEESRKNGSGHIDFLLDNTIPLQNVETENARLLENSEDQTGLLEDSAIAPCHGTCLQKNQSLTLPKRSPRFTLLKPHHSTISRKTPYQCSQCFKGFSDNKKLKIHMHVHEKEHSYECKLCLKRFVYSSQLKRHLRVHAGQSAERKYHCTICSKRFTQKGRLKRHHLTHSDNKNYTCTICSKRFSRSEVLKTHHLTHSGEKDYKCTICSKRFTVSGTLKRHLLTHSGEKEYQCTVCFKRFSLSGNLKRHLLTHSGEKNYKCEICSKRFTHLGGMKSHLLVHSGEKKYQCAICSKRFSRSSYLKSHLLIHSGEKKYQCKICSKRFTQSSTLKSHLLTHTAEKNYKCEICTKRFTNLGNMKRHLLVHSGEKKYQCGICSKRFTQSSYLKTHLLIHSGEKKYQCKICSKRFTQSSTLKSHLLTHTAEKNYKCEICSKRFTHLCSMKRHFLVHRRK